MRSLTISTALFAWFAVALWATACGGGNRSTPGPAHGAPGGAAAASGLASRPRHTAADYDSDDYERGGDADDDDSSPPYDRDGDSDNPAGGFYDSDDASDVGLGHAADASDMRQARSLIDRYFAAVAAMNGRAVCALMPASTARYIPEIYGKGTGPPYARGSSCAQIVANVFAFYRRQLLTEARAVEVAAVRVQGAKALAVLTFKRAPGYPARLIELTREGRRWRVNGMLDNELP